MFGQQQFPLMIPFGVSQQSERAPSLLNEPPARVRVAMEFLQQLSYKTAPRAAVSDHQVEWAETAKLETSEKLAQASAAHLLNEYFSGKMEMNDWERQQFEQVKGNVIPRDKPGVLMKCPSCAPGRGRQDCPLCSGCGQVMIYAQPVGD